MTNPVAMTAVLVLLVPEGPVKHEVILAWSTPLTLVITIKREMQASFMKLQCQENITKTFSFILIKIG